MQVKNPARQDLSMKNIINTIIETIKFWEEKGMDYKNAGVDIEAGYKSVELMKQHIAKTMRPEVLGGIGYEIFLHIFSEYKLFKYNLFF